MLSGPVGCASGEVSGSDGDADSDTDSDVDTETDTDSDSETETETDTDSDSDSETGNGEPELCNNIDDDEDGQTDEDIIGGEDLYEPNQSCAVPEEMGTIQEDSSTQSWEANIYPELDHDFYRFFFVEGDHTCVPLASQDFYVAFTLVPPVDDDCADYDLFVYDDGCSLIGYSQTVGCVTEDLEVHWEGTCTLDDSIYMRIEVRPKTDEHECADYSLSMDMWGG